MRERESGPPLAPTASLQYELVREMSQRTRAFWLDGGSLLGVIRDGRLLPWDRDLDLSAWVEDREEVNRALELAAASVGLKVAYRRYRGRVYKAKAVRRWTGEAVLDVSFWWKCGDMAVRPQTRNMPLKSRRNSAIWLLTQAVRQPLIRVIWPPYRRQTPLSIPRLGIDIGMYSFTVPLSLFAGSHSIRLPTSTIEVQIPDAVDEYLEYRFGNWRTPREHFVPAYEDGSSTHLRPEEVCPAMFG